MLAYHNIIKTFTYITPQSAPDYFHGHKLLSKHCLSFEYFKESCDGEHTNVAEMQLCYLYTVCLFVVASVILSYYYMALTCGRYNARSDWLIVTEL